MGPIDHANIEYNVDGNHGVQSANILLPVWSPCATTAPHLSPATSYDLRRVFLYSSQIALLVPATIEPGPFFISV